MNPGTRHVAGWTLAVGGCVGVVVARVAIGEPPREPLARAPARVITVTEKHVVVVPRRERRRAQGGPRASAAPERSRGRSRPAAPGATPAATRAPRRPVPAATARRVDGSRIVTRYGPVQVRLVMSGTRITDVIALAAPDEVARSRQISDDALPQLRAQVIAAQSADVDGVAGATYTVEGYRQSVQSALDIA